MSNFITINFTGFLNIKHLSNCSKSVNLSFNPNPLEIYKKQSGGYIYHICKCVICMNVEVFFVCIPSHISLDPPENTTISNATIEIVEDSLIPKISCYGNGYPKLQYQWLRNGTVISDGSNLHMYNKMTRNDAGTYECVSRNKHGTQTVAMNISILCKCLLIWVAVGGSLSTQLADSIFYCLLNASFNVFNFTSEMIEVSLFSLFFFVYNINL